MSDFNAASANFLHWFSSIPDATFHPSLRIEDLRGRNAGRGIVTTAPIPADTDLFTIPRSAILTAKNSSLTKHHPDIYDQFEEEVKEVGKRNDLNGHEAEAGEDDFEEKLDPWLKLITALIYEHLRGSDSTWKAYLDVLPETFNTLMFWTDKELAELQGSDVLSKIGKDKAESMFRNILLPLIRRHEDVFFSGETRLGDDDLINLAHRMGSTIMAYAFDLEKEEDEDHADPENGDGWIEDHSEQNTLGMVPMADMLNADAEFNAHLNHGDDALTMVSLRDIAQGEEVLNYYGPLPNADLLRRYGYTSRKHKVYEAVDIPWRMCLEKAREHSGLSQMDLDKTLEIWDEDGEEMLAMLLLDYDSLNPDPNGVLPTLTPTLTGFPDEVEDQVKELLKRAKKINAKIDTSKTALWEIILSILKARIAQYPTTINEDELLLGTSGLTSRRRMAVDVRLGEKELLNAAIDFAEQKFGDLEKDKSAKRAKTSK